MLQDVVTRLAGQSTTIKGWQVTVTGALLGYGITQHERLLAVLAAYVVLAFWALDAYYLGLERAYRELFFKASQGQVEVWRMAIDPLRLRTWVTALGSLPNLLLYGSSLVLATVTGIALV